jgi:hypothetical protein
MVLPGMGVISELISNFSRKKIFGYEFIAFSSIADGQKMLDESRAMVSYSSAGRTATDKRR